MSRRKLKARDKITQKMSRDGLVERNETKGEDIRISNREIVTDLRGESPERQALSQVGTRLGGKPENRTKTKQRQIEAFRERETALSDTTPRNETPPADIPRLTPVIPQDMPTDSTLTYNPETSAPYVNPRDPPQDDSLSQLGTRSGNMPETPQKTALRQDKPATLKHEPADTPNLKPGQKGKLKTQKDSVLQHDKPVEAAVITDTSSQPEQPQTEQGQIIDTPPDDAAQKPLKQPSGEGKRRVQGNTAYRQKNLGVPLVDPITPVSAASESIKPITGNQPAPVSKKGDGEAATPTSPPPKPNGDKPDSQLKPGKPGKLKFSEDESKPEKPKPDRKLIKAERQAERANNKLEKAKSNLPGKKKLRGERVFDEQTGKGTKKLRFEKEITPQGEHLKGALPLRPVKMAANAGIAKIHSKMFQVEHENVEIKAAHRTEMAAEGGVRSALRFRKTAKYRKIAKLERQAAKKSINLSYRKALAENPKLKSNMFSRMMQKRKIRKQYAKKARDAKKAAGAAKKTGAVVVKATKFLARVVLKNPKIWIIAGIIGFIILIVMALFSLAASIGSGGLSAVLSSSYLAEDADMENAALAFSEWEADLRLEILNVQTSHPGFDEYRFDTGNIGHCPVALMAYLTAVHYDFTFGDIQAYLQALFDEQYTLTFTPSMEIRYAPPTEPDGDPIPYEWHIMTVTLTSRSFTEVLLSNMTFDQTAHYSVLMQTRGHRQIVGSPFDFNWFPFVSSHYGWRVHPISGEKSLHRGIDIALPTGTPIRAAHGGVVTVSEYMGGFGNVVFIVGDDGIETRYAHADTLLINVGDTVEPGDIIATVGSTGDSTGPHLHFEILVDGSYVNPAFFAHMGG